jgi:uroporphyrinogen III methyltransferase/synthase
VSSRTQKKTNGPVTFVGAGPGDDRLLTVRGAEVLAAADVVVADPQRHAALLRRCRDDVEVVDATGLDAAAAVKALVAAAREGRAVVRLLDGDPALDGGLAEEADAVAKAKLGFEVVPGVSAAVSVPVHAGVPLTSAKARMVSVADLRAGAPDPDWPALAAANTVVLHVPAGEVGKAATALVEHGRSAGTPVAVTVRGSTTQQRTVVTTLDTAESDVAADGLDGSAVAVVGDVVKLRDRLSWFETKPLFGWKVLVPRTKEQAWSLSEQLRSYGAVPVEVPTIAVEPPRTPAQMDRAINGMVSGRYQWVVFTSTNAVRAVRQKFEQIGLDARAMGGMRIAVVGEMTGQALREWGINPDLVPSGEQSSEGLLEDFPEYDDVFDHLDRVFLPRADIATDTLVAGLKERGWQVDDVTAYRTVRAAPPPAETREAIKTGGFDAVLFTSSSTVRNLVGIAGKPHSSTVIAVIGPQSAKTAEEHGLRVDVQASTASAAALAEALAEFGRERRLVDDELPGKANRAKAKKGK